VTCTHCGAPRAVADRICKKCRFFFEEGRVVNLRPPRAGDQGELPGAAMARGATRSVNAALTSARAMTSVLPLAAFAGVVPGAGHLLKGLRRRGIQWGFAVLALLALSMLLFSSLLGQVLFGLAVAAHSYSIFELTPWRDDPRPRARIFGILGIQILLLFIWWPLLRAMSNAWVKPVNVGYRAQDSAWDVTWGRASAALVLTFMLAFAVMMLARWWGNRHKHGEA
jgi:hypothetical protein